MTDMFADHGFDANKDIAGIILNRWGHAYISPQPGFHFGKDGKPAERNRTARIRPDSVRPFGTHRLHESYESAQRRRQGRTGGHGVYRAELDNVQPWLYGCRNCCKSAA
jgi:hypothetical protein